MKHGSEKSLAILIRQRHDLLQTMRFLKITSNISASHEQREIEPPHLEILYPVADINIIAELVYINYNRLEIQGAGRRPVVEAFWVAQDGPVQTDIITHAMTQLHNALGHNGSAAVNISNVKGTLLAQRFLDMASGAFLGCDSPGLGDVSRVYQSVRVVFLAQSLHTHEWH